MAGFYRELNFHPVKNTDKIQESINHRHIEGEQLTANLHPLRLLKFLPERYDLKKETNLFSKPIDPDQPLVSCGKWYHSPSNSTLLGDRKPYFNSNLFQSKSVKCDEKDPLGDCELDASARVVKLEDIKEDNSKSSEYVLVDVKKIQQNVCGHQLIKIVGPAAVKHETEAINLKYRPPEEDIHMQSSSSVLESLKSKDLLREENKEDLQPCTEKKTVKKLSPKAGSKFQISTKSDLNNLQQFFTFSPLVDPDNVCSICSETFSSRKQCVLHTVAVHSVQLANIEPPLNCILVGCPSKFSNKHEVSNHVRKYHGPFLCKLCSQRFSKRKLVLTHLRSHILPIFKCKMCVKSFKSRSNLTLHSKRMHFSPGDGKYVCKTCKAAFSYLIGLKWHEKSLHSVGSGRSYSCKERHCNEAFPIKSDLADHIRSMHVDKWPFNCQCGQFFKTEQQFQKHSLLHSAVGPFTCHLCEKTFKFIGPYERHLKSRHNTKA